MTEDNGTRMRRRQAPKVARRVLRGRVSQRPEPRLRSEGPLQVQTGVVQQIVAWYLGLYYDTSEDLGTAAMFCDGAKVGYFALPRERLIAADGPVLFRLLVMMTLFQRRQDAQVLRILRGIGRDDAHELGSAEALLALVDDRPCRWMVTTQVLHETCDLGKMPVTGLPCCTRNPSKSCHLKRHTALLKRYGDFGKAPTSAALVLREAGANNLNEVKAQICGRERDLLQRAKLMIEALSRAWRVSEKIASMFLSAVANPDLAGSAPSWSADLDWTFFVVIDSNVDLFLRSIGFPGGRDYEARRAFMFGLARTIDLRQLRPELQRYNPRLVQQAIYMFMSASNRRQSPRDCSQKGVDACGRCPSALRQRCPVRPALRDSHGRLGRRRGA